MSSSRNWMSCTIWPGKSRDEETLRDLQREQRVLGGALEELEFRHMMGEKEDRRNAILTIHPGAGGTESADWAQMLMRMYSRWAERRGFQADVLDLLPGETAGIKSVAIEMKGEYAYGYLKSEMGVQSIGSAVSVRFRRQASHVVRVGLRVSRGGGRYRGGNPAGGYPSGYLSVQWGGRTARK